MFDSETRWFIRCDTCPDEDWPTPPTESLPTTDKRSVAMFARTLGWDIRDDLHRCPVCVREGRTEMAK